MRRLAAAALLLTACAGARTTITPSAAYDGPPINSIAVDGVLREWVALELESRGFTVPDSTVDAQALVKITSTGDYQGLPQSAAIRLVSIPDRKLIASGTWSNGWGGVSGSLMDRAMRGDAADAARQIVNAICEQIAPDRTREPKKTLKNR